MKNLKYIKIVMIIFTLSLISCDDDGDGNVNFDPNTAQTLVSFTESFTRITFTEDEPESGVATVEIGVTSLRSTARTIQLSIDLEESTSTPDQYTAELNTIIPANEFFGTFKLTANFDALTTSFQTVIFKIESIDDEGSIISEDIHRVVLKKSN